MARNCYYRSELTEDEQEIYDCLINGINSFQKTISIPKAPEDVSRSLNAVFLDYPDFFFVDYGVAGITTTRFRRTLTLQYIMSPDEIRETKIRIARSVSLILSQYHGVNPIEAEMFLHDELLRIASYGNNVSRPHNAFTIAGAFLEGNCVCAGYAAAFKYLADRVDLPAIVVEGTAVSSSGREMISGKHAWNMVELAGEYFHVDVTFDKTLCGSGCSRFYLNASDAEVARNHTIEMPFSIPQSTQSRRPVPVFSDVRSAMAFLKSEAAAGKKYSELIASFLKTGTISEFSAVLGRSVSILDFGWYGKIASYLGDDLSGAVGVLWK